MVSHLSGKYDNIMLKIYQAILLDLILKHVRPIKQTQRNPIAIIRDSIIYIMYQVNLIKYLLYL